MNKKRKKLLRRWKNRLWLNEWKIHLIEKKKIKNTGYVRIEGEYSVAYIYIRKDLDFDQWRRTLIHELLHLCTHEYGQFIGPLLDELPKKTRNILIKLFQYRDEKQVSHLTNIFAYDKSYDDSDLS